jgi:hypothetical protein
MGSGKFAEIRHEVPLEFCETAVRMKLTPGHLAKILCEHFVTHMPSNLTIISAAGDSSSSIAAACQNIAQIASDSGILS